MSYKKYLKKIARGNPQKASQSVRAKGSDLDINQRVKLYAETTTSGYYIDYLKRKSEEQKWI